MGKNKYYSKIDSTIYNLEEVQSLLNQNKQWDAILKIKEITGYDDFRVNNIFMTIYNNNMDIPVTIDSSKQPKEKEASKPKCPTCGSTNIRKIGAGERLTSVATFGLFSKKLNKSFKCKNCGYTW